MLMPNCPASAGPGRKASWVCVLLMLLSATLEAAGPDPEGLVLYLSCEDAKNVIDESAAPTTAVVEGTLSSVDAQFGKGLEFNGSNANRIQVAHAAKLAGMSALTIEAWILPRNVASHEGMSIVSKRIANLNADEYNLFIWTGRLINGRVNAVNVTGSIGLSKTVIADNTWYHVALVFNAQGAANEKIKLYVNGVQESTGTHSATAVGSGVSPLWIGDLDSARNFPWDGILDEIGVWNIPLTDAEVQQVMLEGKARLLKGGIASNPTPADREDDVLVTADLGWAPGEYAATHNVYFGPSRDAVDAADPAVRVAEGLAREVGALDVGRMDFGQTYYWRVDEVNAAPDNAVYNGEVWSFTTEPFAYPITAVTATASSFQAGMGPQNTVNGSGLDAEDRHSTVAMQMWLSGDAQPNWIQYEFDKVYKLHEMWVWNANQIIEPFVGFGAKDVTIEYSLDGGVWTASEGSVEFARAPGAPAYAHDTTVDLGGVVAKFVRLTVNQSWGGLPQVGLSEVRFFYVPIDARSPEPAPGQAGVELDASLRWRPGREAVSHKVYFSQDRDAVANGAAPAQTVADCGFDPGAMEFGATYFWRVDEVNESMVPNAYEGPVWSFTTREYAVVDDFESYDDADERIYSAWLDGYADGSNGSIIGYMEAPFAEKTIVHGGKQSMPFEYNNVNTPFYSEAEREFAPAENWTVNGADTLSLWVRGNPAGYVDEGGNITMSAAGTDIWGTADDFRYAFKTLNGDGSILVKVESLVNTNVWAKAGVMIRQDLTDSSKFVYFIQSFGSGVSMGWRPTAAAACGSATQAAIVAPQWVKLTRKGDVFTAQYSADGKAWTDLKNADGTIASTTVAMAGPVYVGLCVTSHNVAATTTAKMSGVVTTGTIAGSWQSVAIGNDPQAANDPTVMYVTIQDSAGKTATATNATAATSADWTQWKVPFSSLTGVNLKSVKKLYLGAGSKTSPVKGGAGMLYIDDIGFGRPVGGQ